MAGSTGTNERLNRKINQLQDYVALLHKQNALLRQILVEEHPNRVEELVDVPGDDRLNHHTEELDDVTVTEDILAFDAEEYLEVFDQKPPADDGSVDSGIATDEHPSASEMTDESQEVETRDAADESREAPPEEWDKPTAPSEDFLGEPANESTSSDDQAMPSATNEVPNHTDSSPEPANDGRTEDGEDEDDFRHPIEEVEDNDGDLDFLKDNSGDTEGAASQPIQDGGGRGETSENDVPLIPTEDSNEDSNGQTGASEDDAPFVDTEGGASESPQGATRSDDRDQSSAPFVETGDSSQQESSPAVATAAVGQDQPQSEEDGQSPADETSATEPDHSGEQSSDGTDETTTDSNVDTESTDDDGGHLF